MRFYDNGAFYSVSVSPTELQAFAERWPCSGMRNPSRGMWFQYDKRNGNLVDIKGERKSYDGSAVAALSHDAQAWAQPFIRCTNCSGDLPPTHGCTDKSGKHHFCDICAALAEALNIGNPDTTAVLLYDDGNNHAIAWTSAAPPLGSIVRKTNPDRDYHGRARFQPVRYRVRMLDGSLWYGYGPSSNGNYIRLRRMKGGR